MRVGVHPLYSVLVFQLSYVVTLKLQINILYPCANIFQSSRCMDIITAAQFSYQREKQLSIVLILSLKFHLRSNKL